MKKLVRELEKASALPLVRQVSLSEDKLRVVVEIAASREAGLPAKNILFFARKGFTVDKVQLGIDKLVTAYKSNQAAR